MAGFDPKCDACIEYRKALNSWRIKGGEMPASKCTTEHRSVCPECKNAHEGRANSLCDSCYEKRPKKPKRYNPLDLVRGKAKRTI